jgi:hypothetical protein
MLLRAGETTPPCGVPRSVGKSCPLPYSIRGLPLAAVAGHCVAIVKVRVLADVESDFLA